MSHAFVTIEKQTVPLFAVGFPARQIRAYACLRAVFWTMGRSEARATFIHTIASHRQKYSGYGPVAFLGNQRITKPVEFEWEPVEKLPRDSTEVCTGSGEPAPGVDNAASLDRVRAGPAVDASTGHGADLIGRITRHRDAPVSTERALAQLRVRREALCFAWR